MYREQLKDLKQWKENEFRKPLIVRGARQVGKTWLLKEFARISYKNSVYINFEENTILQNIFSTDFNIERIITSLEVYTKNKIIAEDTLIIFDEIQAAKYALTSLKYFCENAPQYNIIAAGSLLGMGLNSKISFPVGKVDFMDLRPLSFLEFLVAVSEQKMADAIKNKMWDVISLFSENLNEYLRYYLYVGGMPEVVDAFVQTKDLKTVRQIQNRILTAYEADFSKHAPLNIVPRIRMVWNNIPAQLAKENKKFVYGLIKKGARAKEFEMAIQWLEECGLLLKSYLVSKPNLPIKAYTKLSSFKIFMHDVGILGALAGLDAKTIIAGNEIFTEFKGAITEQYVMQQLRLNANRQIGYWTNDRSTSEVDFIVQEEGNVIPIEVKAGINLKAKSFKLFCEKYKPVFAIRTSVTNYKAEDWMTNIPLYAIGENSLVE